MWVLKVLRFFTLAIGGISLMGMLQNGKLLEKPVVAKTQMLSYWLKAHKYPHWDTLVVDSTIYCNEQDTLFEHDQKVYRIKTQTINSIDSSKAVIHINIAPRGKEIQKYQLEWKIDKYLRWEKHLTRIYNPHLVGLLGSQQHFYFEARFCNSDSTFCRQHYLIISQEGKFLYSGIAGEGSFGERFNKAKDLFLTASALIHPDSGKIIDFDIMEPLLAAWLNDSVFTVVYEPEHYPNAFILTTSGDTLFSFLLEGEREPLHFVQDKELGVHLYFMPLLNEVILFRNNAFSTPQHYNLSKLKAKSKNKNKKEFKEPFAHQLSYTDEWGVKYRFYLDKNLAIKDFEVKNERTVVQQWELEEEIYKEK